MNADARPDNSHDQDPLADEEETQSDDLTSSTMFGSEQTLPDDATPPTVTGPGESGVFSLYEDTFSLSGARVPADAEPAEEPPEHPVHSLMIVEDDAWASRLLLTLLKNAIQSPLAFVQARTLGEGIKRLASHRIQLILTDLGLPDSGIAETVPRLRQAAPDIPVIVLSAYEDDELRRQAMESGAAAYLVKGQVTNDAIVSEILTRLDALPALDDAGE